MLWVFGIAMIVSRNGEELILPFDQDKLDTFWARTSLHSGQCRISMSPCNVFLIPWLIFASEWIGKRVSTFRDDPGSDLPVAGCTILFVTVNSVVVNGQ
jgi:hypothetical protein